MKGPPRRDQVGYRCAHLRLGSAKDHLCACGEQAQEWSYLGGAPDERVDGYRYSMNPSFYEPRCLRCHRRHDGTGQYVRTPMTHCRQGHEYTPDNTYIKPATGNRHCRKCRLDAQRAWRDAKKAGE